MRNRVRLLLLPAALLCGILAACAGKPGQPPETPPVELAAAAAETVAAASYVPEGPGTKELFYDKHWKFLVEEVEPETSSGDTLGTSALICRDLDTGNQWALDGLEYGSWHSYWESVRLYPFTDILGCDGFIFEHPAGAAYETYDFYAVSDTGASLLARCNNEIYTADLDGDGQPELMSNYHNMGYLDLFWTEGENNLVLSCSLNETARDYLGLRPGTDWVSLSVQKGSGEVQASWPAAEDGSRKTRALDLISLWKWEKARTEFWDVLPLYAGGGHSITIRLRESRSRPDDPVFRDYYRIEEVQVYDGNTLIQTISPDDLSYAGDDHLFEGLFVVHTFEKVPGIPDIRDFNLDGFADLGLLAADGFPHNVPYCYFLWDPEAGQLSTDFFILFAPLDIDGTNQQLIEPWAGGDSDRYYQFDNSGKPVLVNK